MMEGVLERAVSNGADNMLRQMRAVMADAPMLTGVPEVQGVPARRLRRLLRRGSARAAAAGDLAASIHVPRQPRDMGMVEELRAMMADAEPRQRERLAQVVRQLEQQAQDRRRCGHGRLGAAAAVAGRR